MALQNHSIAMAELKDKASNFVGVQAPLGRHTIFSVDFGDLTRSQSRATSERGVATAGMRYDGTTSIATFGAPSVAQDLRETAGGPLAMRLPRSLIDIRSRRIPFANDYLPVTVVLAMQKGSSSPLLETDAEYLSTWQGLKIGASLRLFHIPGTHRQAPTPDLPSTTASGK